MIPVRGSWWPLALLVATTAVLAADAPAPAEFAWRGRLELPARASLVRVALPAQALMSQQSRDARDVRVFNAAGEAVAISMIAAPAPAQSAPAAQSPAYPAFSLYSTAAGKPPRGAVSVRIDGAGQPGSVWVRLDGKGGGEPQAGGKLQSAIFTTRDEMQAWDAIVVSAQLPANAPVAITAASSSDLATWTNLPLRGRLYRFEGTGAPVNDRLEFERPAQLKGQYLRLSWSGQQGVEISQIHGMLTRAAPPPPRVSAPLPAPTASGRNTLDWKLDFATPLAGLAISTARPNTLVPLRILGRDDPAQPWRQLGQTLVYRLGSAGAETVSPPVTLGQVTVRWLRLEATHGIELGGVEFQVTAEFQPVQLLFLASGNGPFELAVGRANTEPVALGAAMLASVMPARPEDLPLARITDVVARPAAGATRWFGLLPADGVRQDLVLWAVLIGGVALLAGAAFALLRQLKSARPSPAANEPPHD